MPPEQLFYLSCLELTNQHWKGFLFVYSFSLELGSWVNIRCLPCYRTLENNDMVITINMLKYIQKSHYHFVDLRVITFSKKRQLMWGFRAWASDFLKWVVVGPFAQWLSKWISLHLCFCPSTMRRTIVPATGHCDTVPGTIYGKHLSWCRVTGIGMLAVLEITDN